ncbi:MAG: hypothetical protein ACC707_06460 [Thiohalomonadales bacterium]
MTMPSPAKTYNGLERRIEIRREIVDRREMIRFELDKEPRRNGKDRRITTALWNGRDRF